MLELAITLSPFVGPGIILEVSYDYDTNEGKEPHFVSAGVNE